MKNIKNVTLGGREYEIRALPIRRAASWRAELSEKLVSIQDPIARAGRIELDDGASVAGLIGEVAKAVTGWSEIVLDLVCAWSSEIGADRDALEESAFDHEVLSALVAILGLAFPFAETMIDLGRLGRGT